MNGRFPRIIFLVLLVLGSLVTGSDDLFGQVPFDDPPLVQPVPAAQQASPSNEPTDVAIPEIGTGTTSDNVQDIIRNRWPRVSGAFLQLGETDNDGQERPLEHWLKELGAMKSLGMDLAIIQYNQYNGTHFSEATERILTAADQLGMQVFVGTALNENAAWYTVNKLNPVFLEREGKSVAEYTRIMVRQFKSHPSFMGVYIPYEDNTLSLPVALGKFYAEISQAAKAEAPYIKTMISPFTTLQPGRARSFPKIFLEKYFGVMLKYAKVDVCAWQDGVGGTTDQLRNIPNDLGAIAEACKNLQIQVWANIEVFQRTTPLNQAFAAEATSIETLVQQLQLEAPYVAKIICFDFNHYFSPFNGNENSARLYRQYRDFLVNGN